MSALRLLLVLLLPLVVHGARPAAAQGTPSFELSERFGVAHPEQVVEFPLDRPLDARSGRLVDESGNAVPFQLTGNGSRLTLRSDLPVGAKRRWRWMEGGAADATPQSASGVQLVERDGLYEISNELLAVRIPTEATIRAGSAPRSPQSGPPLLGIPNHHPMGPLVLAVAPVQGLRLRDGAWTGLGPNSVAVWANRLLDIKVVVIETGPLKVTIALRYSYERPEYRYGAQLVAEAGAGTHDVELTVLAGQPSILITEDTTVDYTWALNVYAGVMPSEARYRGLQASHPRFGHLHDGSVLKWNLTGGDAAIDLDYARPRLPWFQTSDTTLAYMAVWNRWITDGGWYWELVNGAKAEAGRQNSIGIFAGPASLALGAGMTGAGIFTLPRDPRNGEAAVAGISSQSLRRTADGKVRPRSRFAWGLYAGDNDPAARALETVPAIVRQMDLHAGPFSLTKLAAMRFEFARPPGNSLFIGREAIGHLVEELRRTKTLPDGLYRRLFAAETTSRPLLDAWTDSTGAKMRAAADTVIVTAHDIVADMVSGRGIYGRYGYWNGGLETARALTWIDQALGFDAIDEGRKAQLAAVAALFGYWLYDNDFVPLDADSGLNLGTANMPQQLMAYRHSYALYLAAHPDFAERAKQAEQATTEQLSQQITASGAHMGAPHYIAASINPALNAVMQEQLIGKVLERQMQMLRSFAVFYLNLLTPPEIRFPQKPRSMVAFGDGSTEPSHLLGQLATVLREADPALSRRLMGAWRESGRPHSGFFGTSILTIDERLDGSEPEFGSASFAGYCSVLRSGSGSGAESAAWIINGDHYKDHRHNDLGAVAIYLLSVPVSLNWGAIYYPRTHGAYYHSTIVPEAALGFPWNQPGPSLEGVAAGRSGRIWESSSEASFTGSADDDVSVSQFVRPGLTWQRRMSLHKQDSDLPLLEIEDSFDGADAGVPKILSLNLLADGAVTVNGVQVVPEMRAHPPIQATGKAEDLASAGAVVDVPPGVTRVGFTGQFSIDFDLFVIAEKEQQLMLGNWAVQWTQQGPKGFTTRQHILRLRGDGSFRLILVPFPKGQRPADLDVEHVSTGGYVLRAGGRVLNGL